MREVLKIYGVWKGFDRGRDRVSVLEDVALTVSEGEIVAVVVHQRSNNVRAYSGFSVRVRLDA
jgi:predicted ABC-type transport system involved in lysophospholipase L1 biosynthesis ATPase subunit